MRPPGIGPFAEDVGVVVSVVRDEETLLALSERKKETIIELLEARVEAGAEHVVSSLVEKTNEGVTRHVGVEHQPQPRMAVHSARSTCSNVPMKG